MPDWKSVATLFAEALAAIDKVLRQVSARKGADERLKYAADALTAIGAITEAVKGGKLDDIDLAKAQEELEHLARALATNDQAADQAVDDKFDHGA